MKKDFYRTFAFKKFQRISIIQLILFLLTYPLAISIVISVFIYQGVVSRPIAIIFIIYLAVATILLLFGFTYNLIIMLKAKKVYLKEQYKVGKLIKGDFKMLLPFHTCGIDTGSEILSYSFCSNEKLIKMITESDKAIYIHLFKKKVVIIDVYKDKGNTNK